MRSSAYTLAAGVFLVVVPTLVAAQTDSPLKQTESTSSGSVPSEIQIAGAPGQGLTVRVGDTFSLNLRSRVQLRYQLVVPPADKNGNRKLQQQVSIGTLRLYASG